jgi:hypothetical protein
MEMFTEEDLKMLKSGIFLAVLEGWTQGLHLLSRCSTSWTTLTVLSLSVIFETESHFMPGPARNVIFLFVLPCIAGMTPLSVVGWDGGISWTFCPSWPWTVIFPISTSQVARIMAFSHHTQLQNYEFLWRTPICRHNWLFSLCPALASL